MQFCITEGTQVEALGLCLVTQSCSAIVGGIYVRGSRPVPSAVPCCPLWVVGSRHLVGPLGGFGLGVQVFLGTAFSTASQRG